MHNFVAIVAAWAGHADGGATALKHYIRVRPGDLETAATPSPRFLAREAREGV